MSSIEAALATQPLSPFDGRDVLRSTIAITKAGDGLSEAMKIEPQEFHHGQRVFVVLETTVGKVRFDPIKDTEALSRVHVLEAGLSTIVSEELVREVLDSQAETLRLAREAAAGIKRLPWDGDEEAALVAAHEEGEHAGGLVEGCPPCDEEATLTEDETAAE